MWNGSLSFYTTHRAMLGDHTLPTLLLGQCQVEWRLRRDAWCADGVERSEAAAAHGGRSSPAALNVPAAHAAQTAPLQAPAAML